MSESERGCGFRHIGGLYLVSDPGIQLECDGLPLELEPCGCCGFEPPFSRNLQRIQAAYIIQAERKKHGAIKSDLYEIDTYAKKCSCPPGCPICHPENQEIPSFGLMFVGKQSYTPRSFIDEAMSMGISKRIPEIPSWLILGETWVFLAHNEVPKLSLEEIKGNQLLTKEPKTSRAIFYGFKPQRLEMPVWKGQLSNREILALEKKGITPVFLEPTPENKKKHKHAKEWANRIFRYLEEYAREEESE